VSETPQVSPELRELTSTRMNFKTSALSIVQPFPFKFRWAFAVISTAALLQDNTVFHSDFRHDRKKIPSYQANSVSLDHLSISLLCAKTDSPSLATSDDAFKSYAARNVIDLFMEGIFHER
jgi:hypothetical protein